MTLLKVENLHVSFHTPDGTFRAVNGVSFTLQQGATLGIVGESGSGKSITSLSLMQLVPCPPGSIDAGTALYNGIDLLSLPEEKIAKLRGNDIAMIFQDPMTSLNPFLKISRQLTETLEAHQDISSSEALQRSIDMLELVGIPEARKRIHDYPHQFSGGMRQRVMIAMSLLCKPKLLIADEPTTALDVTIQAQILELIQKLREELGTTVILITHDLGVVAGTCDHVAVMYAGKIVEYGKTEDIFAHPRHPYTKGLLASLPRLDAEKEQLTSIPGQPPDMSKPLQGCPFAPRCQYALEKCCKLFPDTFSFEEEHYSLCWKANEL